jgi:hypothetical protein
MFISRQQLAGRLDGGSGEFLADGREPRQLIPRAHSSAALQAMDPQDHSGEWRDTRKKYSCSEKRAVQATLKLRLNAFSFCESVPRLQTHD